MSQIASPGPARTGPHAGTRQRRELNRAIRQSMRDLAVQLSLLTHQIGGRLDLKGTDLDCLDLIDRYGPIGPGALARRTGLHPATMTGIIDRLERGGWITRERDPDDRRAITVQLVRTRGREILRLFGGMNTALTQISAGYTDDELAVIADFVRRTAEAATEAAAELPPACSHSAATGGPAAGARTSCTTSKDISASPATLRPPGAFFAVTRRA